MKDVVLLTGGGGSLGVGCPTLKLYSIMDILASTVAWRERRSVYRLRFETL